LKFFKKYVFPIIIILVIWQIIAIVFKQNFLSSPIETFRYMIKSFNSQILLHAYYSVIRILIGIIIAVVIGFPLGMMLGYYKKFDNSLSPIIYFIYPTPKIAFLPVFMLLFGLGDWAKIAIISTIVVFQILINVRDHIKLMDKKVYYHLIALQAKDIEIFRHVLIPAAFPKLLSAVRISLGTSLAVLFFAENFGTKYGLGFFITDSMMRINYPAMYSGIIVLSIVGFLLFLSIDFLQSRFVKWDKKA
jgi:NitT/TauT family transport system permease protein